MERFEFVVAVAPPAAAADAEAGSMGASRSMSAEVLSGWGACAGRAGRAEGACGR